MNTIQSPGLFIAEYLPLVLDSLTNDHHDNYDSSRFGPEPPAPECHGSLARATVKSVLTKLGLFTTGAVKSEAYQHQHLLNQLGQALRCYLPNLADIEWLHSHLSDDESREILRKVFAFRALGHRRIKLPINNPEHWARIRAVEEIAMGGEQIDTGFMGLKLTKITLREIGYPIELYFTPGGVVCDFIEQQYRCETPDGSIECSPGDTAIDAGGCWGDTALYFAHKVGEQGKVASFEFLPSNLSIFQRNMALNPDLSRRIQLYEHPVWSVSGENLEISANGPGTTVGKTQNDSRSVGVESLSIDDLVERGDLERVDFVKMDVEGAELEALRGAEHTLRRFKPKLAITVYHNLKDFWTIPQYLDQLGLGYRFYLRHFTIHAEETVLFATI